MDSADLDPKNVVGNSPKWPLLLFWLPTIYSTINTATREIPVNQNQDIEHLYCKTVFLRMERQRVTIIRPN